MKRIMAWVKSADYITYQESEVPSLKPNQILLKTQYSAICGSDLHLYHDIHPYVKAPSTIGHELAGVVVAIGSQVEGFIEGDLVCPEPILTCGSCDYCLKGNYHMCNDVSFQYRRGQAGFANYFIVDARWAHKVPKGVDARAAALIEPLSVAIHSVDKAGEMLAKNIVVLGAGTIGTLIATVCKIKGANQVWVIDINDYRLAMAEKLSGAIGINSKQENFVELIKQQTNGLGCDIVIECTGVESCVINALDMVKKLGIFVQVGISSKDFNHFPYAKFLAKEITLKGAQGYCFNFEQAVILLKSGIIHLDNYITHIYPSEKINEAFELVSKPDTQCMKVLISY